MEMDFDNSDVTENNSYGEQTQFLEESCYVTKEQNAILEPHKCSQCDLEFQEISALENHLECHGEDLSQSDDQALSSKRNLQSHIRTVHEEENLKGNFL